MCCQVVFGNAAPNRYLLLRRMGLARRGLPYLPKLHSRPKDLPLRVEARLGQTPPEP